MKLLFDQNLSPGLVGMLADPFADSLHVQQHAARIAALEGEAEASFLVLL